MTTDRKQASPSTFTGTIPTGVPTFTGTFTPPIHDQLIQAQARIAELEAREAEAKKPCVWKRNAYGYFTDCMGLAFRAEETEPFCSSCGHSVEVKENP